MRSIMNTTKGICFMCGRYGLTEKHHIFGAANRRLAEADGLFVYLCRECHNQPPNGAHFNPKTARWLHMVGQGAYEAKLIQDGFSVTEARQMFLKRYGKNYL